MQLLYTLGYLSALSPLLALIVLQVNKQAGVAPGNIYLLCELAILTEILSRVAPFHGNNLPYLHAYSLLELGLVLLFFSQILPLNFPDGLMD